MLKNLQVDSVYIAIWSGEPTRADCEEALRGAQSHQTALRRRVPLMSVLTQSTKMPSDLVRQRMASDWPALISCASSLQFVNLTRGFTAARMISLLVPLFQLGQRGKVGVHQSLDAALAAMLLEERDVNTGTLKRQIEAAIAAL